VFLLDNKEVVRRFIQDLKKMEPTWRACPIMSGGVDIRRETREMIRMFPIEEGFWSVYVFCDLGDGIRYRDKAHSMLTPKEAIILVQNYIKKINEKNNRKTLPNS